MGIPLVKQNIRQASIMIAVFAISSQVLGLLREIIVASFFGTSAEYDVLVMALALPLMLSSMFFMAIPSAGIPFLSEAGYPAAGPREVFRSSFLRFNTVVVLVLSLLTFLLLPYARDILAKGLPGNRADAVIMYARWFCLLIPFKAYEAIFRGFLQLRYNFFFPTLTNLGFNVAFIILLLGLFPALASWAFVTAWLIGTSVQVLMVAIPSYFIYRESGQASADPGLFKTTAYARFLAVILFIEGIGLAVAPFDRYLAGLLLAPGHVSAVNYADIVSSQPSRILIFSLGTAIFPTLAEKAAHRDAVGLARIHHRAIAVSVMLMIPVSIFFVVYANEIVQLLFERGAFVASSRLMSVQVLRYYSISFVFASLLFVQIRTLYAIKLWRPLALVKLIGLGLKVLFGLLLIKTQWALAIGGGSILMFVFCTVALEYYLVRKAQMTYSSVDKSHLVSAFTISAAAVAVILAATGLLGTAIDRTLLMFLVGGAAMAVVSVLDWRLNVTGINLRKLLPGVQ